MNYAISINAAFITGDILDAFAENMYGISGYLQPKDDNERRISRPLVALLDFNETRKFSRYYSYKVEHPVGSAFQEVMEYIGYGSLIRDRGRIQSIQSCPGKSIFPYN